jgi:adenosine kinase
MSIIVTGSIATDTIMFYPGHFREQILVDDLGKLSVSFLVENKQVHPGGCGPNIAYSLALLGRLPRLMGAAGRDFADFGGWLSARGVDTSLVRIFPDEYTSTFTVLTDLDQNQIAGFHAGAMSRARELTFRDLDHGAIDLAIISPNDPQAMGKYARECQQLAIPFIYDPSQQLARIDGPEILASMQGARALTVNDYELGLIRHKTGLDEAGILQRVQMIVVTRGASGATIMSGERRVDVPVAPALRLADPTGVGDAFRAGLITGLVRGYAWEVMGRLGALAATYVLEQVGTMQHAYTLTEFIDRYRETFGEAPELADLAASAQIQTRPRSNL